MLKYIRTVILNNGVPSSKRFITVMAFFLMAIGFLVNLFLGKTIDPNIYDSMKWIVVGGLGFTASEQFAKGNGETKSTSVGNNAINAIKDIANEATVPSPEKAD